MGERGFDYRVVTPPLDEPATRSQFGTENVARARNEGYGIDRSVGEHVHNVPSDPNALYVQSLNPRRRREFDAALFGPPSGPQGSVTLPSGQQIGFPLSGCLSQARKRLYGADVNRFMTVDTLVGNLEGEIVRRVRSDGDLVASLKRWRSCMREAGFSFADPNDALEAARVRPTHERAIAVADATCARATDLVDIGRRLLRRYQDEVYTEFEGRIVVYNELTERGLDHARQVLRGSSG